jgi:hypothetical protein
LIPSTGGIPRRVCDGFGRTTLTFADDADDADDAKRRSGC